MCTDSKKELRKKGDYPPEKLQDLEEGSGAMKAVLERANSAIEKMKKDQEVQDLLTRVDDWKGHKIEQFGELITFGTHAVLKGDSGKDEREVSFSFIPLIDCVVPVSLLVNMS